MKKPNKFFGKEEKLLKKQQEERAQAEKQALLQQMTPLRREMEEDSYSSADFMDQLTNKWLGRMEKEDAPDEEKTEIARLLMEWYEEYNPQHLSKPNKKNKKKIERIRSVLGSN